MKDLKIKIKNHGYNQSAFATMLGINSVHLCKVLNGQAEMSKQLATKIGKELKIHPAELLFPDNYNENQYASYDNDEEKIEDFIDLESLDNINNDLRLLNLIEVGVILFGFNKQKSKLSYYKKAQRLVDYENLPAKKIHGRWRISYGKLKKWHQQSNF